MRFTLQINTGNFAEPGISAAAAEKLRTWLKAVPAERVIYGWTSDSAINTAVNETAHRFGAQTYVWLPVFAEAAYAEDAFVSAVPSGRNTIDLVKGESFEFVCPSSEANIGAAFGMLEKLTRDARPDGVFLDRIRYPSMHIKGAGFGCMCGRCLRRYADAGTDIGRLRALTGNASDALFVPCSKDGARYRFDDPDIDRLFAAKRGIITRSIAVIAERLRSDGYLVGLDLFAPVIADYVGQDIRALCEQADMVKPMMYYSTTAPAGLPFETAALPGPLQTRLKQLWSGSPCDEDRMPAQLDAFGEAHDKVSVGLEINRVSGVCSVTKEDLRRRLLMLKGAGYENVTLCWNVFCADVSMADVLNGL